jgi:hypothetical protein
MELKKKTIQELTSAIESLKLQEADLTAQLEEALEEQEHQRLTQEVPAATNPETRTHGFAKGDRVWITNQIKKPSSWDNSTVGQEIRRATVTEVLIKNNGRVVQVHFETDNGVTTWRAPNNLRLLDLAK